MNDLHRELERWSSG